VGTLCFTRPALPRSPCPAVRAKRSVPTGSSRQEQQPVDQQHVEQQRNAERDLPQSDGIARRQGRSGGSSNGSRGAALQRENHLLGCLEALLPVERDRLENDMVE